MIRRAGAPNPFRSCSRRPQRACSCLASSLRSAPISSSPGSSRSRSRLRRSLAAASSWPRIGTIIVLSLATLLPLSIGLGLLFDGPEREGLLALGLAPSEVAVVALVALAGGNAAVAVATVVLSLVVSALVAPLVASLLTDTEIEPSRLLLRFSLVVLVPLAVGLALRAGGRLARLEPAAERAATLVLALLVYAALGDLGDVSALGPASLAAALFLAASLVLAALMLPLLGDLRTGAFAFALRDFAVAAALATQLNAPGAAATAAVYGVLMLLVATVAASLLRRRRTLLSPTV